MKHINFTEYCLPDGRRLARRFEVSDELYKMWEDFESADFHMEFERLSNGVGSLTIGDDEGDWGIQLFSVTDNEKDWVEKLITEYHPLLKDGKFKPDMDEGDEDDDAAF